MDLMALPCNSHCTSNLRMAGLDSDAVQLLVQSIITRQPEDVLTLSGENISLSCEANRYTPPNLLLLLLRMHQR